MNRCRKTASFLLPILYNILEADNVDIFTQLNKYFGKHLNLMITNMTLRSTEPFLSNLPTWQAKLNQGQRQEMTLELIPLGSLANRTYNLTLEMDNVYLNGSEILFDSNEAHIPADITGDERIIMRLGYMIYKCYKAANGACKDLKDYPSYLVNWSISSRA